MAKYIEREAVIDALYAAFKKYWKIPCSNVDMVVQRDVVHTKNKIYDIPAADVAPVVHGRWMRRVYGYDCSECGAIGYPNWKRCPLCEAKMDGERKGDDAELN